MLLRAGTLVSAAAFALSVQAAASGAAGCSRATADAAIRQARPRVPSPESGSKPFLVTPDQADLLICFDFTGDGRPDLAVTVASGGTAGDIGWFVLVRTRAGWRQALARGPLYKVGLFRVGGDLVDSQPVYRRDDPNCCPTGGFDHTRWRFDGHRFVNVRSWHTRSYRP